MAAVPLEHVAPVPGAVLTANAAGLAFDFRPLSQADVPLLHRWLNAPHVVAGYTRVPMSLDEVARKYGPQDAAAEVRRYMVWLGDRAIGFVQTYAPSGFGHAAALLEREDGLALDVLIGEFEYTQRGLGPRVIEAALATLIWPTPGIRSCVASVRPEHSASIRAFRKAGFTPFATVTTRDGYMELVMERKAPEPR